MSDKHFSLPGGIQFQSAKKSKDSVEIAGGKEKLTLQTNLQTSQIDSDTRKIEAAFGLRRIGLWIYQKRGKRVLAWPGGSLEIEVNDLLDNDSSSGGSLKPLKLTMPGKVLSVKVKVGDVVDIGSPLVIVEAMKMENLLLASARAKISQVHVQAGDRLDSGTTLISFSAIDS